MELLVEGDIQVPTVMAVPQSLSPASGEGWSWGLGEWRDEGVGPGWSGVVQEEAGTAITARTGHQHVTSLLVLHDPEQRCSHWPEVWLSHPPRPPQGCPGWAGLEGLTRFGKVL